MPHFEQVSFNLFTEAFEVHTADHKHKSALTPVDEMNPDYTYYLSYTGKSGFGLSESGDLVSVFSVEGAGADTVQEAIKRGACTLDCFDGFLPEFYKRFGFYVTAREPNWTPGGPDVIFMAR